MEGGKERISGFCPTFPLAQNHRTGCILTRLPWLRYLYMYPETLRKAGRLESLKVRTADSACTAPGLSHLP